MKGNNEVIHESGGERLRLELETPEYNPRTREWETPPPKGSVEKDPYSF